jgi:hypothetical protein
MARCGPPKTVTVSPYDRAAPPHKARRKPTVKKPTAAGYWTCVNSRTGRTCGTHHHTHGAAIRHRKRLDLESFRAGRGRPWDTEERS